VGRNGVGNAGGGGGMVRCMLGWVVGKGKRGGGEGGGEVRRVDAGGWTGGGGRKGRKNV